jgi:2-polyprenyl-3-methyl-5-hydroxy-6-metoxy-1,4-benzoquinol methylase
MKNIEFKPVDIKGMEILTAIEKADKFNFWMYQTILPHCKGKVLEIGSGSGNISQFFIKNNWNITLSDIRDNYCELLKKKFNNEINQVDVLNMNLVDPDFDSKFRHFYNQFDTVFALNVIEHIEDDKLALRNIYKLLKKEGHVIILVPAYQALYNAIDASLDHYRRYVQKQTNDIILKAGFEIIHEQYFNAMGIPAWFISGKLQKNDTIKESQMSLYNKLVPVFRIIDKIIFNKIGLSNISVGRK